MANKVTKTMDIVLDILFAKTRNEITNWMLRKYSNKIQMLFEIGVSQRKFDLCEISVVLTRIAEVSYK